MAAIGTDLIPGTTDDPTRLVTLEPQPHAQHIQTAQRQIDLAEKLRQRLDIRRTTALKKHPSSKAFATPSI